MAGVQVGRDGLDGLFRALPCRIEPQADPIRFLTQQRLQPTDRPPAWPVRDAVTLTLIPVPCVLSCISWYVTKT
jgi:hypothetical protein